MAPTIRARRRTRGSAGSPGATHVDATHDVTLADGTVLAARAVVLATGVDYGFPELSGMDGLWGNAVIHCPFCHGWEARDARIGLLVAGEEHAAHLVPMLRRLSADVEAFDAVAGLRSSGGVLEAVLLPDDSEVTR